MPMTNGPGRKRAMWKHCVMAAFWVAAGAPLGFPSATRSAPALAGTGDRVDTRLQMKAHQLFRVAKRRWVHREDGSRIGRISDVRVAPDGWGHVVIVTTRRGFQSQTISLPVDALSIKGGRVVVHGPVPAPGNSKQ